MFGKVLRYTVGIIHLLLACVVYSQGEGMLLPVALALAGMGIFMLYRTITE